MSEIDNVSNALHWALVQIKEHGPLRQNVGICANVYAHVVANQKYSPDEAFKAKLKLDRLCAVWPNRYASERKCDKPYGVGGMDAYWEEKRAGAIWQNPRRFELLNWLIESTRPLASDKAE